jgi:hypothetical protein
VVVLAGDPWWAAVCGGSPKLARQVALSALQRGYLPAFVAVPAREDVRERLLAALSRRGVAAAVLGPPISYAAGEYAGRFPRVTFILVGAAAADDGIANTVQLVFDRDAAFREAGSLAASVGPAAVLAAEGRPEGETAAFIKGYALASGAPSPVTRTLGDPPDPGALKSAVAELRGTGVSVFLYRPTRSGSAFLDELSAAGGCAVVEDWAAFRPRPQQVLASIEDDLPAGIRACLARGAPAVVTVPAVLVRGSAASGDAAGTTAGTEGR